MRKAFVLSTILYYLAVAAVAFGADFWLDRMDAYLKPHEDSSLAALVYALPIFTGLVGLLPLVLTAIAWGFKSLSRRAHLTFGTLMVACHLVAGATYVLSFGERSGGWHLMRPWLAAAILLHLTAAGILVWATARTQDRSPQGAPSV